MDENLYWAGNMDCLNQCPYCGNTPEVLAGYLTCKPCGLAILRNEYAATRGLVFGHYGWSCVCCGALDYPSIDHVWGNGKAHREADPDSQHLYRWLVEHGLPAGFQTLCRSCNSSKGDGMWCRIHGRYLGPMGSWGILAA